LVNDEKIQRIFDISKKVLKECSLENGAIVASNIRQKGFKNYFYVWPRDASFVCVACDLIGLKTIPERFFRWCWNYAESFREKGIFFMRYHTNGKKYGIQFQPDQIGSLIWAIEHHSRYSEKFNKIVEKAADGICSSWNVMCFRKSFDIWEEKVTSSKKKENHTYSLAMCIKGLNVASKLLQPKEEWLRCIEQMKIQFNRSYDKKIGYFLRTFGDKTRDKTVDSSLLGLVWPSEIVKPNDKRIISTINKIIRVNSLGNGIMRYKGDKYIGKLKRGKAGAWPILNFWLSIYFSKLRKKEKALKYFKWVIERVDEELPEQIKNDEPSSIIPLTWSHAMFIIAGKFLDLF